VARGSLAPSSWLDPARSSREIRREIGSIKGAGPYVADNVMKLLGRYEGLGIDSWCRREVSRIRHRGRRVSDRRIGRFYEPFGRWRGLALWCDITRDWFEKPSSPARRLNQPKY
jgi:3-methyladenine DNA glycosylase/8-oxoguanine DNA glycosylase